MKKKLAAITTIGLSCALALSLAACGGDTGGGDNKDKAPNPDDIKTEQVSETEWKSAFDFSEVTNVTFKRTNLVTALGETDETYALAMFDGNKIYNEEVKYTANGGSITPQKTTVKEFYSVSADEIYIYEYNSTDKKYEKEATGWYPTIEYYLNEVDGIVNAFSSFTYDSSKSAYVSTELAGSGFDYISVKIKGGKAAVVQMDADRSQGAGTAHQSMIYQAYNIGTTKVTLPKVAGEGEEEGPGIVTSGEQVTKEQWNAAMSVEAYYNVTAHNTMTAPGITSTQIMKYDSSSKCIKEESDHGIYLSVYEEGEDGARYILRDGAWVFDCFIHSGTFESELSDITSMIGVFDYDAFTYKNGVYSVKGYQTEEMGTTFCNYVNMEFNKAKLVRCEIDMTVSTKDGEIDQKIVMEFYNYGMTVVDRPDFGGDEPPMTSVTMSEKEFDDALSAKSFHNCIVVDRIKDERGETVVHAETWVDYKNKRVHEITYMNSTSFDSIIAEVDGSYYLYLINGSNYTKQETTASNLNEVYANCFANFEMFVGDFDKFTYDEKTQSYVAHKYTLTAMEDKIADEVKIHFVGGKVDSVILTITENGSTFTEFWYVTNYGTTEIEVPVFEK